MNLVQVLYRLGVLFLAVFCSNISLGQTPDSFNLVSSYRGRIEQLIATHSIDHYKETTPEVLTLLPFDKERLSTLYVVLKGTDSLVFTEPRYADALTPELKIELESIKQNYQEVAKQNLIGIETERFERLGVLFAENEQKYGQSNLEFALHNYLLEKLPNMRSEALELLAFKNNNKNAGNANILNLLVDLRLEFRKAVRLAMAANPENCPPVTVKITDYCDDTECEGQIKGLLGAYVQDTFYGLEQAPDTDGYTIGIRNKASLSALNSVGRASACICPQIKDYYISNLNIAGGNIQVADSFVLIGKDELHYRFLDDTTFLKEAVSNYENLSQKALIDSITAFLERKYFANKTIVWVGTEKSRTVYNPTAETDNNVQGYSPFYHIDLFVSLLGPNAKNQNEFEYILSVPDSAYQYFENADNPSSLKAMTDSLRDHVLETAARMEKEVLDQKGIRMKRIEVPLMLVYGNSAEDKANHWLADVYSFANGLVENTIDSITYYLPDYTYLDAQVNYELAREHALNRLKEKHVAVIPIKMDYYRKAALHCMALVVARSER